MIRLDFLRSIFIYTKIDNSIFPDSVALGLICQWRSNFFGASYAKLVQYKKHALTHNTNFFNKKAQVQYSNLPFLVLYLFYHDIS